MIDKIELLLNKGPRFSEEYWSFVGHRRPKRLRSVQSSYGYAYDFREVGIDLKLHVPFFPTIRSKFDILDAGALTRGQIFNDLRRLLLDDPLELDLARVDLAADIPDFDVNWFRQHVFVPRLQTVKDHLVTVSGQQWSYEDARFETLTIGKRPNIYRIYDKVAELLARSGRALEREINPAAFLAVYGLSPDDILTRMERQIGGRAIPKIFPKLGALFEGAHIFNPFDHIQFVQLPSPPNLDGIAPAKSLDVLGLWYLLHVEKRSVQEIRKEWNRKGRRGKQVLDRLLPVIEESASVSLPNPHKLYLESLQRQLAD